MSEGRSGLPAPLTKGVLLTGTIGAGKSALAAEVGEILEERNEPSAVIDVDWMGWTNLPNFRDLMYRNLAAVWANYAAEGVRYLVLSRLVEFAQEIEAYRLALPGVDLAVVRIDSDPELVRERLERRDSGTTLDKHLIQTVEFARVVRDLPEIDHVVVNDRRPIRAVANEILGLLGWNQPRYG